MIDPPRGPAQSAAMPIAQAILPAALLIFLGLVTRRSGLLPEPVWQGIAQLCFCLLIPASLLASLLQPDLLQFETGPFGRAFLAASAICALIALALPLGRTARSTIFMTGTQPGALIAVALCTVMLGAKGANIAAHAITLTLPLFLLANMLVLTLTGGGRAAVRSLALNPILLTGLAGIALNLSGTRLPGIVAEALPMLLTAGATLALLTLGAMIRPDLLLRPSASLIAGILLRIVIGPVIFWAMAVQLELAPDLRLAGLLIAASPAAAETCILASQLGGEPEHCATTITWQIVLAIFAIPITLSVLA